MVASMTSFRPDEVCATYLRRALVDTVKLPLDVSYLLAVKGESLNNLVVHLLSGILAALARASFDCVLSRLGGIVVLLRSLGFAGIQMQPRLLARRRLFLLRLMQRLEAVVFFCMSSSTDTSSSIEVLTRSIRSSSVSFARGGIETS